MQTILKIPGFTDNAFTHLLAGSGAGLFAVFIGSPVDVVGVTFDSNDKPDNSEMRQKIKEGTKNDIFNLSDNILVLSLAKLMLTNNVGAGIAEKRKMNPNTA